MSKNIAILSTLLLAFVFITPANASPVKAPAKAKAAIKGPGWALLGTRTVRKGVDHDEIMVTARDGVFTGLRLKVRRAGIRLLTVRVVFGNGEDMKFAVNKVIPQGKLTRVLDLPGNKRIIRKVVFNYKTVEHRNVRAIVELYGRR